VVLGFEHGLLSIFVPPSAFDPHQLTRSSLGNHQHMSTRVSTDWRKPKCSRRWADELASEGCSYCSLQHASSFEQLAENAQELIFTLISKYYNVARAAVNAALLCQLNRTDCVRLALSPLPCLCEHSSARLAQLSELTVKAPQCAFTAHQLVAPHPAQQTRCVKDESGA